MVFNTFFGLYFVKTFIMKTLLVLTDFSKAAEYAASYACILAEQLKSNTIVLYHSYQVAIPVSEAVAFANDEEAMHQTSLQGLKDLEIQIKEKVPHGVVIRQRADMSGLSDIGSIAKEEGAELIVMGTSNKTKFEEIFLGSSAITVCKSSDYPIVLVPASVEMQPVSHIVFACDMKEVEKTIPATNFKKVLDSFKVPLSVLNVDDEGNKHFTPETSVSTITLHDILKDYNANYFNINNEDVVKGIIEFTKLNPAAIVLLILKRHNFIESLFYRSVTRKLAYETPFPLLVLREREE